MNVQHGRVIGFGKAARPTRDGEVLPAASAPRVSGWMAAIVLAGAALSAAGALLALAHPQTLLDAGQQMNGAAHVYAGYLVSRGSALAIALVALLLVRARRMLAGLLVLVAFVQLLDGIIDVASGRSALLPPIVLLALAFLFVAGRLFGRPVWKLENWRDERLTR